MRLGGSEAAARTDEPDRRPLDQTGPDRRPIGRYAIIPSRMHDDGDRARPVISRRLFLVGALGAGAAAVVTAGLAAGDSLGSVLPTPTTPDPTAVPSTAPSPSPPATPSPTPTPSPMASPRRLEIASILPPRRHDHPVARENRRPGTWRWNRGVRGSTGAEGYASAASVEAGDRLGLHIAASSRVDVDWYRLGWYGGSGGRLVRRDTGVPAVPRRPVRSHPLTGIVEPGWPQSIEIEIDERWTSGLHVAVLRAAWGHSAYVPFVVRPPSSPSSARGRAPILFVSAATTWQAYNAWGGRSLYGFNSTGLPTLSGTRGAVTVSFDRPYARARGSEDLFRWETQLARWQEREERDVEYIADLDLELHPELVEGRRLLVFAGHHEYWSAPMRRTLERAIGGGTNVCFLSANQLYWAIRLNPSRTGPGRRITCFRGVGRDVIAAADPARATTRWRDAPLSEPEAALVGQQFGHVLRGPADWVVSDADHWIYQGTGLRDGDRIRRLIGGECDTYVETLAPPDTRVLARSPVETRAGDDEVGDARLPREHTATIYTAESGATVFAAGTFQWAWALDDFRLFDERNGTTPVDPRVGRMTANLYDRLGDGPARRGLQEGSAVDGFS